MKSRGGVFPVKRSRILAVLMLATLPFLTTSCGTGDKIGSVSISAVSSTGTNTTGTINLVGLGATIQLQVLANYTSGKQVDETNFATYTVTQQGFYWSYDVNGNPVTQNPMPASPLTLTINKTGMVTSVDPALCSWYNYGTSSAPGWFYTGWYEITATYRGFTSQPIDIPLASAGNGQAGQSGQCGPKS
jgi:hypothetical protein